jgi:hypothetical protein
MRLVGHVVCTAEDRKVYSVSVVKPEGKRPLGIPRCVRGNEIRMGLWEIGGVGVEWIYLDQVRTQRQVLVKMVINPWVLAPWS